MDLSRRDRQSLALLAGWALACLAAFSFVYVVSVRTTFGRLFADASLRGAILSQARAEGLVDNALGVVTVASLAAAVAVIAVIALVRLRRGVGLAAVGVLVVSNSLGQLLKEVLLERPDLGLREYAPATLNSLPSGHSTAAFSVVVALLLVVPSRLRGVVAAAGGAYAVVVALATMAAGWHRPADSVAAFLLVGLWAGVAVAAVLLLDRAEIEVAEPPVVRLRRYRSWVTVALLALGVAAALMMMLVAITPLRENTVGEATAFGAGALFIAGTAIVVLAGLHVLLERIVPGTQAVPAA